MCDDLVEDQSADLVPSTTRNINLVQYLIKTHCEGKRPKFEDWLGVQIARESRKRCRGLVIDLLLWSLFSVAMAVELKLEF